MEDTKFTILEAAQAARISKNTAKYRLLKKAPAGTISKGPDGLIYVSAAGVEWLKATAENQQEPPVQEPAEPENSEEPPVQPPKTTGSKTTGSAAGSRETALYIDLLKETVAAQAAQIQEKDRSIAQLLSQLEATTKALQTAQDLAAAAQAIHAGEIQKSLIESAAATADQTAANIDPEPKRTGFRAWWADLFGG